MRTHELYTRIMLWCLIALFALGFVAAFGCGARAEDGAQDGWCCGGAGCGLEGRDVDVFVGTCLCHGVVRPDAESLSGSCVQYEWPEH